jgi:hypothetical protein
MIEDVALEDQVPFLGADWVRFSGVGVRQQVPIVHLGDRGPGARRYERREGPAGHRTAIGIIPSRRVGSASVLHAGGVSDESPRSPAGP